MSEHREPFLMQMARLITPKQGLLALLFFAFFAYILSWKLAAILMGALMFHELGHAWAMRHYGLRVGGFYFMPPFGLAVVTRDRWPTRQAEAVIALMGPIWGFGMALATYGVYLATGHAVFAGLTAWFALLNGFNLLPTNPLDGGRVAKSLAFSLSPKLGLVALLAGLGLTAYLAYVFSPLLGLLIFWMGALEFRQEWRQYRRGLDRQAILAALADRLGVPRNAHAALGELCRRMNRQEDRMSAAGAPGDGYGLGVDVSLALAELRRSYWSFGGRQFVTAREELIAHPRHSGLEESPLGRFLLEQDLPKMAAGGLFLTLIVYLGLAAALFVLFLVSAQAMSLTEVIGALR